MNSWKKWWKKCTMIVVSIIAVIVVIVVLIKNPNVIPSVISTISTSIDTHKHAYISSFPPLNVTFHNASMNVTNNWSIPDVVTYGTSTISSMVGIIALIIAIIGAFLTLEIIGVGNFRQHFINTLEMCNCEKVDMNKEVPVKKWICLSKKKRLLDIAKDRRDVMHKNSYWLAAFNKLLVIGSILALLAINFFICFCDKLYIGALWSIFRAILLIYVVFFIFMIIFIFYWVSRIVSYADLADLHKAVADNIISDIENKQEKVQHENTDGRGEQETLSENAGDKKES